MPVSTRSQIKINPDQNEPSQVHGTRQRADQEETNIGLPLRNPHHGLKEKMKALTLLYEQQKQACAALRNPPPKPPEELPRFLTHPSVDLVNSTKKEEKMKEETKESKQSHVMREIAMPKPNSTVTRTYVLPYPPAEDGKENTAAAGGGGRDRIVDLVNSTKKEEKTREETKESKQSHVMRENAMPKPNSKVTRTYVLPYPPEEDGKENTAAAGGGGGDRIVGFSCPRKANVSTMVARKLSMGSSVVPQSEPRGVGGTRNGQEQETISEKQSACGSRILVFVRLRPMGKKEREAGSRCCVRIVNRRDLYLSEFATENDYLRLKRLRGRHFTFDAAFPDSTSQQEVYSTT